MITAGIVRRPLVALAVAVVIVACSSAGGAVAREEVEQEAAAQLAAEVDQPEPDISCPEDLEAEVGATMDCELSVEGDDEVFPVRIEVTAVDGDDVQFDAVVGDAPIE